MNAVERFRTLISLRLGLQFEDAKVAFLGEVLRRRCDAAGLDADAYLAALEHSASPDESGALAQELTVPETYFFRNIDQFNAFAQAVLPERMRARQTRRALRIVSAGCASGEEPYSLAVLVRESCDPSWDVSIRAVDLNPAVLERAAKARYSTWALRETPEVHRRWFRPDGRDFILDDSIRHAVQFDRRNLAQDDASFWQPETNDVVFCRNVLMYFAPENARALIGRIAASLAPGGFLFLGHAETLRGLSNDFHLRHTHNTFYYQRKESLGTHEPAAFDMRPAPPRETPPLSAIVEGSTSWFDAIQKASERIQALARSSALPAPAPKPDLKGALDLLQRERFAEALDAVRRFPPESARDPDVLMLEAVLLTHSGRLDQAQRTCERLLSIDELSAGAHYVLALCREAVGDRAGAAEQDQLAAYLSPTFAMPRLHLGLLARRAGDVEAARRELSQARILLRSEDESRLLLFGGGFGRDALMALCDSGIGPGGERP